MGKVVIVIMQSFYYKLFLKWRLSWQMFLNLDYLGCSLMATTEGNMVNLMLLFNLFYSCIFSMLHSWKGEVALEIYRKQFYRFTLHTYIYWVS
jgi:hypothetical protein